MLLPLFHPIPLIHRPHQVTAPNNDKGMYRRRQFPELVEIHSSLHPSVHPSSATLHPSKFSSTMAAAESKAAMVLPSSCLWNCEKTDRKTALATQCVKYQAWKTTGSWGSRGMSLIQPPGPWEMNEPATCSWGGRRLDNVWSSSFQMFAWEAKVGVGMGVWDLELPLFIATEFLGSLYLTLPGVLWLWTSIVIPPLHVHQ